MTQIAHSRRSNQRSKDMRLQVSSKQHHTTQPSTLMTDHTSEYVSTCQTSRKNDLTPVTAMPQQACGIFSDLQLWL